jgi:hypothetical protein
LTTVLVILLRYPKPISQILSSLRLQRITSNWGEGAFGDEVGVLNAGADKAMIPPAHPDAVVEGAATFTGGGQLSATGTVIGGDTEGFDARIAALAAVSPLAAVAWAWQQVRQRLAQVVEPFMREGHHIR